MTRRLVVEADGGSRGNPGPAGFGALVRDAASGEVLAESAESIGVASNNVAEYRGLIAGLTLARDIDPAASVEVRMDSKLVVEQMSGRWKIKHPSMRPLAIEAAAILPAAQVTYGWIPRERNKDADRLANQAMDAAAGVERETPVPVRRAPAAPVGQASARPDLGPPTTLILLRHGETEHTAARRLSGSGGDDPGLSDKGIWQADRAAAAMATAGPPDAIVSSPLRRTRETAQRVADAWDRAVRVEDGFAECAFGEWDGLTFAEIREKWPAEFSAWCSSPAVAPPAGESLDALTARVQLARDRTFARYARRTVLVVTHATPIKTLVRLALEAPWQAVHRMHIDAASFTVLTWYADGNASLRRLNDISHLP